MTVLAWQRGGALGGPAVVLVHAWASDGPTDWERTGWVDGLGAAGFDVLVPDLPGHGESADVLVPGNAAPASWTATVLLADLERLRVGTVGAVGAGDGCVTAGHLAVRAPDGVNRLVLVGTDDRAAMPNGAEVAAALRDPDARLWNLDVAAAVARARRDRRHHLPTLADWAERMAWPAPPQLGALRTPTLLAVGSDDGERRKRVPRLAQLFHDARVVTAPGDEVTVRSSTALIRTAADFLTVRG
jgi:pimeloyl-ACP methyl ester carboxylesterase